MEKFILYKLNDVHASGDVVCLRYTKQMLRRLLLLIRSLAVISFQTTTTTASPKVQNKIVSASTPNVRTQKVYTIDHVEDPVGDRNSSCGEGGGLLGEVGELETRALSKLFPISVIDPFEDPVGDRHNCGEGGGPAGEGGDPEEAWALSKLFPISVIDPVVDRDSCGEGGEQAASALSKQLTISDIVGRCLPSGITQSTAM